ncbi:hypothetical protein H4W30_004131 [Amycolatopsis roodepoortensis]|uniref:Uncharacterized protein n=1 Tax=Amycolatopsis roodepoortensis TaxID=700274 RepID=A0ABR9L8W6_9PSEU|nr:hypothetical protein [Amycolatopsis roodepoortensis]
MPAGPGFIEKQGGATRVGRTAVGDMGFAAYFKDPKATSWGSGRPRDPAGPVAGVVTGPADPGTAASGCRRCWCSCSRRARAR